MGSASLPDLLPPVPIVMAVDRDDRRLRAEDGLEEERLSGTKNIKKKITMDSNNKENNVLYMKILLGLLKKIGP